MNADGQIEAMFYREVGRRIRYWRLKGKFSQEAIGLEVGVVQSVVCRWESGEQRLTVFELVRLADVLGCAKSVLTPTVETAWGVEYKPLVRERERYGRRPVQSERDPMDDVERIA